MDPTLAFLDAPRDFDTVSLARSTETALAIIVPWCKATALDLLIPTTITREIEKQARVYAKAIDFSVGAAQDGFTVAEEALSLVGFINSGEATAEDRRDFLVEMTKFSQKGREKASEAHARFVGVGTTIEQILSKMRNEEAKAGSRGDSAIDSSKELQLQLEHGMRDLEKFRELLSKFVAWWNEMEMESNTQLTRESMVIKKFDRLRLKGIEFKWIDHRKRYAAYVDEIGRVQDRYPDVFNTSVPRHERLQESPQEFEVPPRACASDVKDPPRSVPGSGRGQSGTSVVFSEELSSASYMSASLSTVQVLEPNKCLLVLHFQCHPSETRRFTSLRINWRLRNVKGERIPKVLDIAPKQSIGARNEERHRWKFGVTAHAKFAALGGELGPEVTQSWEGSKKVARAMVITGSTRGLLPDAAQWSVTENGGAKTGIPPHFQVALVVEYGGIFMMELDVVAKQLGNNRWWSSRNRVKAEIAVNVDRLHGEFQPQSYGPPQDWRKWFPKIKGEVEGGMVENNFQPLSAYDGGL